MKKILCLIVAVTLIVMSVACSSIPEGEKEMDKRKQEAEQIFNSMDPDDLYIEGYDVRQATKPIYEGNVVYNESVMLVKNKDGSIAPKKLTRYIDKIIAVKDSSLTVDYVEGEDFTIVDGAILPTENTRMRVLNYTEMHPQTGTPGVNVHVDVNGDYMLYGEYGVFHEKQIWISYISVDDYDGFKPTYKGDLVPLTKQKLNNKEDFSTLFIGDSITAGANASEFYNIEPYSPRYSNMVVDALNEIFGMNISHKNIAVGGKDTRWGIEKAQLQTIADTKADLFVIAFGMNDGVRRYSKEEYKSNIQKMIDTAREANPDTEIILIGAMMGNSLAVYMDYTYGAGYQPEYREVLQQLEEENEATIFVDVTSMHLDLLEKKEFMDMTGNNLNHPNDFMMRVYAQCILTTLVGEY